jgi:hypothetical protein
MENNFPKFDTPTTLRDCDTLRFYILLLITF